MNRIRTVLIFVVLALSLFIVVFFYGRFLGKKAGLLAGQTQSINSQIVLDRITDQYFLVTKNVFADSKVEIETLKSNDWKDLFLGKKVTVRGLVRIDVGVDMKNMQLENIEVDTFKKLVTINLPHAEILNSSLSGQLDIEEDKAILDKLKGLLKNTQNEDYNSALAALIDNAKSKVLADESIFTEARNDSGKLIELIVTSTLKDYQVVIK